MKVKEQKIEKAPEEGKVEGVCLGPFNEIKKGKM